MKDINYSKISNVIIDGIDHEDHPKYCDAYIVSADYDGMPMPSEDLEELSDEFVHEQVMSHNER